MREAGRESWCISRGEPWDMVLALYVRDACGLSPDVDPILPPLDPRVSGRRTVDAAPEASRQWTQLWGRLLAGEIATWDLGPPNFAALSSTPILRELMVGCLDGYSAWSRARQREHITLMAAARDAGVESELVRGAQRRLGHPVRPFQLKVAVLPVAGVAGWRIADDHVLVSRDLLADAVRYGRWLRPVIDDLA